MDKLSSRDCIQQLGSYAPQTDVPSLQFSLPNQNSFLHLFISLV